MGLGRKRARLGSYNRLGFAGVQDCLKVSRSGCRCSSRSEHRCLMLRSRGAG